MKTIVIASTNPVKINATLEGFKKMFPKEKFRAFGISVSSGVSDQPLSDAETYKGAFNRAKAAKKANALADYWVGLEGGVEDNGKEMRSTVWVVIFSKNKMGKAKTGSFILPPRMTKLIRSGMEMGHADDKIFGVTNSKQTTGAVGILTKGVIDRTALYETGVILALIPFLNPTLYK